MKKNAITKRHFFFAFKNHSVWVISPLLVSLLIVFIMVMVSKEILKKLNKFVLMHFIKDFKEKKKKIKMSGYKFSLDLFITGDLEFQRMKKKSKQYFILAENHNHNPTAQFQFGLWFCGYGSKKGIKWYEKAAKQNHCEAQYELGRIYVYGYGVKQNITEGTKLFKLSANQNHPYAQSYLGDIYFEGRHGIPKDISEAIKWYHKRAENENNNIYDGNEGNNNNIEFQYKIGLIYFEGDEKTRFPKHNSKSLQYFYFPLL